MKGKNIYINPDDKTTTLLQRGTTCCGGHHQTIAGAVLNSPQWHNWYAHASKEMLFDVDETLEGDAMSDKHFQAFLAYCKTL